jgi:hypothetical protein
MKQRRTHAAAAAAAAAVVVVVVAAFCCCCISADGRGNDGLSTLSARDGATERPHIAVGAGSVKTSTMPSLAVIN